MCYKITDKQPIQKETHTLNQFLLFLALFSVYDTCNNNQHQTKWLSMLSSKFGCFSRALTDVKFGFLVVSVNGGNLNGFWYTILAPR